MGSVQKMAIFAYIQYCIHAAHYLCITSAKRTGWVAIFVDIQYCIYGAHYLFTMSAKGLGGWGFFLLKFSTVFMLIRDSNE